MRLFRCAAKNVDPDMEESEWVEGLVAEELRRKNYIGAAVRQEMHALPLEIANIQATRFNEIWRVLEDDESKSDVDHVIAMYI